MVIKENKIYETEDGYTFHILENAQVHDNALPLYKVLEKYRQGDKIHIDDLWEAKDELIQFFIDKGYVKKVEESS